MINTRKIGRTLTKLVITFVVIIIVGLVGMSLSAKSAVRARMMIDVIQWRPSHVTPNIQRMVAKHLGEMCIQFPASMRTKLEQLRYSISG